MPEYSTPKLTPSGTSKLTGMNSSNPGYFEIGEILDIIRSTYGQANGVATLDANQKLTSSQLPDLADDVIVVASLSDLPSTGEDGKLYIVKTGTAGNNLMYRWDTTAEDYVQLSVDLSAYATKTEVQTADTELKNAINQHEARIENLEQKAGDYVEVQYRGTNAVPSGKAKNALVETIVGKSRGWNSLSDTDFRNGKTLDTTSGNYTYDSTGLSVTLPSGSYYEQAFRETLQATIPQGHNVLLYLSGTNIGKRLYGNGSLIATGSSEICIFSNISGAVDEVRFGPSTISESTSYHWNFLLVRDLSLILPDFTPTGTLSTDLATILAKCPDILKMDAVGYSLVDTEVEGVESCGSNLFNKDDFTLFNGYVSSSGVLTVTSSGEKTFIFKAKPLQAYYLIRKESYGRIASFENSPSGGDTGTMVSTSSATAFTFDTLAQTGYLAITFRNSLGNSYTYEQDLEGMYLGYGTSGSFAPYVSPSTLSLSSPVTLRSAGTVADTDELNVEVNGEAKRRQTTKVYHIDMGTLAWTTDSLPRTGVDLSATIKAVSNSDVANITCGQYEVVARNYIDAYSKAICVNSGGYLIIRDTSFTGMSQAQIQQALSGVYADIELATYTETLLDPIINCMIPTEGGGTINTIQTQTPQIDNCLDVAYLAL